jgi:hypothetical protein
MEAEVTVAVVGPIRTAGESKKDVVRPAGLFIGTARAAKALRAGYFQFVDVVIVIPRPPELILECFEPGDCRLPLSPHVGGLSV